MISVWVDEHNFDRYMMGADTDAYSSMTAEAKLNIVVPATSVLGMKEVNGIYEIEIHGKGIGE